MTYFHGYQLRRTATAVALCFALAAAAPAAARDDGLLSEQEIETVVEILELQNQGSDVAALERIEESGMTISSFQTRVSDLAYLAALTRLRKLSDAVSSDREIASTVEQTLKSVEEQARAHFSERGVPRERWEAALDRVAPHADEMQSVLQADLTVVENGEGEREEDEQ